MRRIWCGLAVIAVFSVTSSTRFIVAARAQSSLGEMGTASSMSGSLGGGGGMNTSASSYLRGLPQSSGIPGGSDPTNFGDASRGGALGSSGGPNFPSPNTGRGGAPGGAAAAAVIPEEPFHWNDMRGADFVRELRGRGTNKRTYRQPALRRAPYRRPVAKYPLAPRGWLSYYLQQDRYKFATRLWNYVSIEDDRGRYPVKYYYRPSSPTMLALIANSPRGVRRYNRVIGFKSWQDAMTAGLRPDPISKPEPAPRVLQLAGLSRGSGAMRMIEAAYAGQMSPAQFNSSVDYVRDVAREVSRRRETRALTGRTVDRVVLALLGEGTFPTTVVGRRARVVLVPAVVQPTTTVGGRPGMPGAPGNFPGQPAGATNPTNPNASTNGSGQENRMDQYNRFQQNAAGLRR